MSTINAPAVTSVSIDASTNTARIRVEYTLQQSASECGSKGLRYRESIQLWGPGGSDSDGYLYTFASAIYTNSPDSDVSRVRTVTIPSSILDETARTGSINDIQARVVVTPVLPTPEGSLFDPIGQLIRGNYANRYIGVLV